MEQKLKYISEKLIQQGGSIPSPGLLHGKMGLVVFFFHYAQYTGNESFKEYAFMLMERIQEQILHQQNIDYADGLAGIGAGIEYLSQTGFLDIDMDEILEDFDSRVRQEVMYRQQTDCSLFSGLCGLGQYLFYQLNCRQDRMDEFYLLANQELLVFFVNILENEASPKFSDLPDILLSMSNLRLLNTCNSKTCIYIEKILTNFSVDDLDNEYLYAWTLTLLRIASIRNQTVSLTCKI